MTRMSAEAYAEMVAEHDAIIAEIIAESEAEEKTPEVRYQWPCGCCRVEVHQGLPTFGARILVVIRDRPEGEMATQVAAEEYVRMAGCDQPCPNSECGHTEVEHRAFDAGIADGEAGYNYAGQYKDGCREAYVTGLSVGVANREAANKGS